MKTSKFVIVIFSISVILFSISCHIFEDKNDCGSCESCVIIEGPKTYEDGTYRGVFIDKADIQVNIEFKLSNSIVEEISFRHLKRDENYHLNADQEPYKSVIEQYQEALDYLKGKNIEKELVALYNPENIVTKEVDGYTSATLRTNKFVSAIRDALNRGVYSY